MAPIIVPATSEAAPLIGIFRRNFPITSFLQTCPPSQSQPSCGGQNQLLSKDRRWLQPVFIPTADTLRKTSESRSAPTIVLLRVAFFAQWLIWHICAVWQLFLPKVGSGRRGLKESSPATYWRRRFFWADFPRSFARNQTGFQRRCPGFKLDLNMISGLVLGFSTAE
jgi:hypothetical protein